MRPRLYLLVQPPSWTFRRIALAVANKSVIGCNVAFLNASSQQIAAHVQRVCRGQLTHEAANETDSQRKLVVAKGMGADRVPTAALIDVAVTANQEIVSYIIPSSRFYVEALQIKGNLILDWVAFLLESH